LRRGHGQADELINDRSIDLDRLDEIIASGGAEGAEASRMLMTNRLLGPGRFGKMFPDLEPFRPSDDALDELGRGMREGDPGDPRLDNSGIPAGITYLGQFIDHDITHDGTQGFPLLSDPDEIEQQRTPTLDLDSLYGLGPARSDHFFDPFLPPSRARFRIGRTSPLDAQAPGGALPSMLNDLPRGPDRVAVIGDDRNDENTIVAQTHLAFLKFHNRVMDEAGLGRSEPEELPRGRPAYYYNQAEEDEEPTSFHAARRLVRWHYQWLVLHDFLPKIVDSTVLKDVRENGRRFYRFEDAPFDGSPYMPLEFSAAAYRFGHSMIRQSYDFNRIFNSGGPPAVTDGTLALLFVFTGGGGFLPPGAHLTLPTSWVIDWRRFFDLGRPDLVNLTRRIDTKLIPELHGLPPQVASMPPTSLPVRNLLRASRVGLPAAQDVAEAMEVKPLSAAEIASGDDGPKLREHGFHERTPLWYYVLKEAELQSAGKHLGEIGSRIVSEVFVGLLDGDKNSFRTKQPDWTPTLPAARPGTFLMSDLLRFVNEINPLGVGPEGP